jgi:hypothetical protein
MSRLALAAGFSDRTGWRMFTLFSRIITLVSVHISCFTVSEVKIPNLSDVRNGQMFEILQTNLKLSIYSFINNPPFSAVVDAVLRVWDAAEGALVVLGLESEVPFDHDVNWAKG